MSKRYYSLLNKIAPIIYKAVYQNERRADRIPVEYQDLFTPIKYWGDPEDLNFSTWEGNWQKLSDPETQKELKPEMYHYITETDTHYFVTFTMYHASDWKLIGSHDNDLESIQYVVKKNGKNPIIQVVYTSPHHVQHVYYNPDYFGDHGEKNNFRKIVFDEDGRPKLYCQPENAPEDLVHLYRQLGMVGHGIHMVGDGNKISDERDYLGFWTKKGYVCRFDPENVSLYKDNLIRGNDVKEISYGLIPAKDYMWELRRNDDVFDTKKWHPEKQRFRNLRHVGKRFELFKKRYGEQFENGNIILPSSMRGKKDLFASRPKSPFVLQLNVDGEFYERLKYGRKVFNPPSKGLFVTMDPVIGWKIKLRELFDEYKLSRKEMEIDYLHHPCLEI